MPRNGISRPSAAALSRRHLLVAGAFTLGASALASPAHATTMKAENAAYDGYLFVYFTGEGTADGEQIHLALSKGNDPLHWRELNGGRPVLTSSLGDKGVRDPFVIRSPEGDRFFLIATDLKINGGAGWDYVQRHGSRSIIVWESDDLVRWSEPRSVQVSPETAGNTWAPEACWSTELKAYVVFWASKVYAANDPEHTGNTYNRMLYATTTDFVTFSEAQVWNDPGYSVIDSTVIAHDGTYYRFTKDERSASQSACGKFILQERATDLLDTDWEMVSECIGSGAMAQGEGPLVFKSNSEEKWFLFVDDYTGGGYIPFESRDLVGGVWTEAAEYRLPSAPRHGTVLPVTRDEYARIEAKWGLAPVLADANGLVAHWPLTANAEDVSGHGYHGTATGDARWADGALVLCGAGGHIALPENMLAGVDAVTVAADVWVEADQQTPYFLYGFGNTDSSTGHGDGYLFATGGSADDGFRAALSDGNWSKEQGVNANSGLPRGRWVNVTYTVDGATALLHLDGAVVARNTAVTLLPSDIGGGRTTANYLGRSQYTSDRTLKGRLRDVRLYNRALSADEIAALPANATRIRDVEVRGLAVPAVVEGVGGTVVLPVEPGTDLRRLRPEFTLAPGARISPASGRRTDLRIAVTYTVTSADGAKRRWKVSAAELRTPVLPGFHADPNIVAFGGTYYLYSTTDGFDGWSGTRFSVWSSKNLVDWTDRGVILDLGKDVSWAESRAWAPTIAERDGRYFFYYCAEAKIGVATATSPTGPFTDSGKVLIAANPDGQGQAIDPAVFTDDDGQAYLYWGNGSAWVAPLNDDMVSYEPSAARRITGLDDFREGLFMVRRKGLYHLTYSIDDTRSENYRVGYATSTTPYGPFTYRGIILSKDPSRGIVGTGHNSVLRVPGTDDWYICYHRFALPDGDGTHRETTIDRVTFGKDGLMRPVVPTLEGVRPRRIP
ncbi:family 43 glycosylhydrolase [Streptomyces kunmingensis]|uniref:Family 43 glycosylhydrolase n=1 Tax=Streptomyces kunmingensis TaxID=68225 RepID=A0ABU6CJM2_9ACTN|nr:family 43 glycosylhydrolase [Streptomyces kunmingensis]MEB3964100.1 family 43 glycosylhydrolase [Streptomyces kunmingensis]